MHYPIMLNIKDKLVTVVGGGEVALRKIQSLIEYDPVIRVVSPEFHFGFKKINYKLELVNDFYREELIKDSFIVISATSSSETNRNIATYCKKNRILCNIADDMELSDFIVPSGLKRGNLVISISTHGKSPALASKIRKELEEKYGEEYELYIDILGEIRELLRIKCSDIEMRKQILKEILKLSLDELIKKRDEIENGNN